MIFSVEKILVLRVISAQNLPKVENDQKDIIDPYVSVKVRGHPADERKFKTQVVENNGAMTSQSFLHFLIEKISSDPMQVSIPFGTKRWNWP